MINHRISSDPRQKNQISFAHSVLIPDRSVLIDDRGKILVGPDDNIIGYALSLGFIMIRTMDEETITVWLIPNLVRPKTMAAAFFEMATFRPQIVYLRANNKWEHIFTTGAALRRIEQLITAASEAASPTSEEHRGGRTAADAIPISVARNTVLQGCLGEAFGRRLLRRPRCPFK
jgi:hypothetical protein